MGLNYKHLDEETRRLMIEELDADIEQGTVYISDRLMSEARTRYIAALKQSIENGNDDTFASELSEGYFNTHIKRRKRGGSYASVRMPQNAPQTLAEGEFNRYYIRALCRRAMENASIELRVFRAKAVDEARWESESRIGMSPSPVHLLNDLRRSIGVDTALGIPAGPNSGLSIELVMI